MTKKSKAKPVGKKLSDSNPAERPASAIKTVGTGLCRGLSDTRVRPPAM